MDFTAFAAPLAVLFMAVFVLLATYCGLRVFLLTQSY